MAPGTLLCERPRALALSVYLAAPVHPGGDSGVEIERNWGLSGGTAGRTGVGGAWGFACRNWPERPSSLCSFPPDPSDDPSLQRSVSVATGLNMMKKQKVKTIFPHTAGTNQTLLSFAQGDVITLLISEEKDGWLYGEHDATKVRGWFPSSYTKLLEENAKEAVNVPSPSPAPVRSMSTVDLSEKACAGIALPPPDYSECLARGADVSKPPSTFKAPASKPEAVSPNNTNGMAKPPFLSGENPFATVKLRPTVTNDRSAPIIR